MQFRRQRREDLGINLTPLIDVVFLLLIFFMVSTTFIEETELEINLPQAANGVVNEQVDPINIVIGANGALQLNGALLEDTSRSHLSGALRQLAGNNFSRPLTISADANARHQSVVMVMDVAAELGFNKLGIATLGEELP